VAEKTCLDVRARRFFINNVVRPPVVVIGFLVKGLYWLIVGWWFEPRYDKRQREKLEKSVRNEFSFLFVKHQARILSTTELHGWPVVTVFSEGLLIQFLRWRDECHVRITPEKNPASWIQLLTLLNLIEPETNFPPDLVSFAEASKLLHDRWKLIRSASVPDFSPELKLEIENSGEQNRFRTRQQAIEINQELYGE
jgi:hypothetical protein